LTANYYTRPAQSIGFALLGRSVVKSFADYHKMTDWDGNAKIGNFTPAVIGLEPIWTIPALATNTTTPVSILHDPSLETMDTLTEAEPLFWHGSDVKPGWVNDTPLTRYESDASRAHSGHCCISISNAPTAQRVATWTTSAIPVKPGITMGVNLWLAADKLTPATAGEGVGVTLRFTDATGFLDGETHIIGNEAHPELIAGTYAYTHVAGQGVVPTGACWMTVILSAAPSAGTVRFDDIHISMVNPTPPSFAAAK
jgi:hypothetical protein